MYILWLSKDWAIVVNRGLTSRVEGEQSERTVCTVQNMWWKKSESGVKRSIRLKESYNLFIFKTQKQTPQITVKPVFWKRFQQTSLKSSHRFLEGYTTRSLNFLNDFRKVLWNGNQNQFKKVLNPKPFQDRILRTFLPWYIVLHLRLRGEICQVVLTVIVPKLN